MEKEKKVKNFVIVALVLTVMFMSAAFAGLNASLNVNGTVKLPNASWDVGFASAELVTGSVGTKPEISTTNNTVTYEVELNEGETYEFNAVIENNGTYDAKMITYEVSDIPTALAGVVTYEVTQLDPTNEDVIISAKDSNGDPGELTIHVKISMGSIDTTEKLTAVQQNSTFKLTILAEFEQVVTE